jgi:hypothetical protein
MLKPILDSLINTTGNLASYKTTQGVTFVNCAQRNLFVPIKVMFSGYYLAINVEDYIHDYSGDGTLCQIMIAANSYDFYVFG